MMWFGRIDHFDKLCRLGREPLLQLHWPRVLLSDPIPKCERVSQAKDSSRFVSRVVDLLAPESFGVDPEFDVKLSR